MRGILFCSRSLRVEFQVTSVVSIAYLSSCFSSVPLGLCAPVAIFANLVSGISLRIVSVGLLCFTVSLSHLISLFFLALFNIYNIPYAINIYLSINENFGEYEYLIYIFIYKYSIYNLSKRVIIN